MRLTLRNLLAYLDGILDPQDAQDIAKKIDESKFAADLMHRIRDLLRRLRLAAPSLSDRGPGLDPNTVAEYLDNTLPAEQVTDFEKVCLDSNTPLADVHLAEVAACHQILTLVLGEPTEIEPAARDRMYQLPSQPEKQASAPPAPSVHLPPPIPPQHPFIPQGVVEYKSRAKPTVPDYLREPSKRRHQLAVAIGVAGAICILLLLLNVFGQLEHGSPVRDFFVRIGLSSPKTEVASSKTTGKGDKESPVKKGESDSTATVLKPSSENGGAVKVPSPESPNPEGQTPPTPPNPQEVVPSAPEIKPETPNETPSVPSPDSRETPSGEKPPEPATPDANGLPGVPPPLKTLVEPPNANPKPSGRFTSPDQILLRSADDSGNWERLLGDTILFPSQHLLALPAYRPTVTLSSGLNMQMLGGTEVELLSGDLQSPPGIKIRYGQVVIRPTANAGMRLRLVINDRAGTLTFVDAETTVGIEVRRLHAMGANPENELPRTLMEVFVTAGRLTWEEDAAKPLEIAAPARINFLTQTTPTIEQAKDFPPWIMADSIKEIDRRASKVMLQEFAVEKPAQPKLLEVADTHRQKEVRWLAIRSLGYLGYFDPMVQVLNEPAYKNEWNDNYISWLRKAIERDPQTAAAIRGSLEKHYGAQAAGLYRMLWGYTNKDLIAGDDAQLVKNLENESLAIRVLGIWNLKEITGKDLAFKPEDTLAKRLPVFQRWKKRLDDKEIRIKSVEEKPGATTP